MPPPSPPALLPSIVVFVMVAVASPKTLIAPPLPDAEGESFPENVESVTTSGCCPCRSLRRHTPGSRRTWSS